jgi:signal transduction histidine kinase/ligand-binding sensor domain-containing protein
MIARCGLGASFTVEHFLPKPGGLPKSVVRAVIQSRDGYLWLGTPEGLARFDGVDFTVFDENNSPGLKSRNIVSLFEDSQSNLWVGTDNAGVALVKDGRVIDLGVGQMRAACEDTNGAVWFYTDNGRLCRYRENKVDEWSVGAGRDSFCRSLAIDETGLLWVGTVWSLTALGPISAGASAGLPVAYETPTNELHRLDLLLASKRGGYWRLGDFRVQKWKGQRCERDWPYPSTNSVPVAACEDLDGNLVIGTYGAGVFWFDAEGHADRIASEEGLSHNFVLAVTVDREGSLWVGTTGGGLNRVKPKLFNVLEKTRGTVVQSVCEDEKGGLWIGYNGQRVDHWSGQTNQQFDFLANDVTVKTVLVDARQQVWAGSQHPNGLRLFQLQKSAFVPIFGEPVGANDIAVLYKDRKQGMWIGGRSGLERLDEHKLRVLTNGPSRMDVRAVTDDADGNLWIGTEANGITRFREGKFTSFTRTNGLPSDEIRSLYMDEDSVLWAGTSSGLARHSKGKWTAFSKREGLLSDSLGYLVEDGQGYLWMASNVGLLRVKKKELNDFAEGRGTNILCRSYGEPEGLPADECTFGSQPGAIRTRDGKLWFPTIKGLAYLNPEQLKINPNPPPVMIESVAIDGKLQNTNALTARPPQSVTVPAGRESIDIKYTSLNLAAPDKGHFKFRLKEHEKEWRDSPWNIRTAHYTRVPPGNYEFEVTACNEDGVWNEKGSTLRVEVLPPFWSTWWFRTIVVVCLVGMIVGSVHYVSTQRLQRQVAALRQQEALEKERARIARDLHDQLGANLTRVALLGELAESDKDSPQEVEAHARQISQTARDTTHSLDEIVWTVNPSNDTLDGLVNYVCKYAQEYLAVAGLKYRLEVPAQLPGTPISPELRHNIFLASKEAITNIVRHARATAVSVRLRLEPESFSLEIEDNGKGLAGLDENKGRNGLRNMRKRLEDVGGEFSISAAPEGGTRVKLTAPLA